MRTAVAALIAIFLSAAAYSQPCYHVAREVAPVLSPETKALYEKNLEDAEAVHLDKPNAADSIIWLGRRMAYLGRYKDAIRVFSSGLVLYKNDARLYRHRGHRNLTLRCFDDAIRDFETAAKLVKGKPDEIEPDGLPNAKNIPTSTLQSNIWYHLGLAYYLKGDFAKALRAYEEARKVSKNSDMLIATMHWKYMTLRRLRKKEDADAAVAAIPANLQLIENGDYYILLKLYKGIASGDGLIKQFEAAPDTVSRASLGYGLGNRYLYHNKRDEAAEIFRKIVAGKQWASFGYIAAEVELERLNKSTRPRVGRAASSPELPTRRRVSAN
jgi:tetratricopeptide (TPR) repeat protein